MKTEAEELRDYYAAHPIADDNTTGSDLADIRRHENLRKATDADTAREVFANHGLEFSEPTRHAFLVKHPTRSRSFYFYSCTGKWRVEGSAKVYRSRGALDFVTRFVTQNS